MPGRFATAPLITLLLAGLATACGTSDNTAAQPGCPVGQVACSSGATPQTSTGATGTATACASQPPTTDNFKAAVALATLPDGLQEGDFLAGTGAQPSSGKKVTVQYTGWLDNGCVFDTSRQPGRTPFSFTLGQGEVIRGWDEGVATMKVGGKRRLVIPSALAYGDAGQAPVIPPKATLTFDIELLSVG